MAMLLCILAYCCHTREDKLNENLQKNLASTEVQRTQPDIEQMMSSNTAVEPTRVDNEMTSVSANGETSAKVNDGSDLERPVDGTEKSGVTAQNDGRNSPSGQG